MNRILSFLFGTCEITVSGASPELCINALSKAEIIFWDVCHRDEMHLSFSILLKDRKKIERIAVKSYCTVERAEEKGLPLFGKRLLSRPVLTVSMTAALFFSFFLQSYVWVIEVDGSENVPNEVIIRELEAEGISFGTRAAEISSQEVKNKMLNAVPQLSWLAVNRTGGKLTVLVTERQQKQEQKPKADTVHVVAAKDGVITDYSVSEGMKLCARGDTVRKGQILVSGYEDYGLFVRNVCAEAEIYAKTWYSGTVVTPAERMQKVYTGRTERQISLLIGRKRIKLFGNSSIFGSSCDKMVTVERLSLPKYSFPLAVETVFLREYTLQPVSLTPQEARKLLREAWKHGIQSSMIAGTVDSTAEHFITEQKLFVLRAESTCTEMIAKQIPIEESAEGETNE